MNPRHRVGALCRPPSSVAAAAFWHHLAQRRKRGCRAGARRGCLTAETVRSQAVYRWARRVSNLRPLACEVCPVCCRVLPFVARSGDFGRFGVSATRFCCRLLPFVASIKLPRHGIAGAVNSHRPGGRRSLGREWEVDRGGLPRSSVGAPVVGAFSFFVVEEAPPPPDPSAIDTAACTQGIAERHGRGFYVLDAG